MLRTISLILLVVVVTAAYTVAINLVDMPEEWLPYVGFGLVLGIAVGRGWIVAASLAALTIVFQATVSGRGLTLSYVVWFYIPLAALSIALGVILRRVAVRAVVRRRLARS